MKLSADYFCIGMPMIESCDAKLFLESDDLLEPLLDPKKQIEMSISQTLILSASRSRIGATSRLGCTVRETASIMSCNISSVLTFLRFWWHSSHDNTTQLHSSRSTAAELNTVRPFETPRKLYRDYREILNVFFSCWSPQTTKQKELS